MILTIIISYQSDHYANTHPHPRASKHSPQHNHNHRLSCSPSGSLINLYLHPGTHCVHKHCVCPPLSAFIPNLRSLCDDQGICVDGYQSIRSLTFSLVYCHPSVTTVHPKWTLPSPLSCTCWSSVPAGSTPSSSSSNGVALSSVVIRVLIERIVIGDRIQQKPLNVSVGGD